jgi:hypothetical protein
MSISLFFEHDDDARTQTDVEKYRQPLVEKPQALSGAADLEEPPEPGKRVKPGVPTRLPCPPDL